MMMHIGLGMTPVTQHPLANGGGTCNDPSVTYIMQPTCADGTPAPRCPATCEDRNISIIAQVHPPAPTGSTSSTGATPTQNTNTPAGTGLMAAFTANPVLLIGAALLAGYLLIGGKK